jgi:acyl homoserine lactone synthase
LVFDIYVRRILQRAGCQFNHLGPIAKFNDLHTVGGLFEVSEDVVCSIAKHGDEKQLQRA